MSTCLIIPFILNIKLTYKFIKLLLTLRHDESRCVPCGGQRVTGSARTGLAYIGLRGGAFRYAVNFAEICRYIAFKSIAIDWHVLNIGISHWLKIGIF